MLTEQGEASDSLPLIVVFSVSLIDLYLVVQRLSGCGSDLRYS
jgi:hypothetical protein